MCIPCYCNANLWGDVSFCNALFLFFFFLLAASCIRCNYRCLKVILSFTIGTGIVTSVPSDAPDDFAALRDLKNKQVWIFSHLLNDMILIIKMKINLKTIKKFKSIIYKFWLENLQGLMNLNIHIYSTDVSLLEKIIGT